METKQGVLKKIEVLLKDICNSHPDYSYRVNKIDILIYHTSEKNAIIDIYGRIKNQEIRVYISDKSPEYKVYISDIQGEIDLSRCKSDGKSQLNFSFYIPNCQVEKCLRALLEARL